MLSGISQIHTYYALHASHYACILLQDEQHYYTFLLLECSIRAFTMRALISLILYIHAIYCILNVLLETINLILAHFASIIKPETNVSESFGEL